MILFRESAAFYDCKTNPVHVPDLLPECFVLLSHLRQIERSISQIEVELHRSMKNVELFQMMELEKSLIYFSTSLKSNETVLERILRSKPLKMYEEDAEFLEDVIIENKQAMEMSQIYLHILNGMTQAFATIISNNLNIVMKFLASVTIIIAVPTMIASFYGMNVIDLPLSDKPLAFEMIFGFQSSFRSRWDC